MPLPLAWPLRYLLYAALVVLALLLRRELVQALWWATHVPGNALGAVLDVVRERYQASLEQGRA